MKDLYDSNEFLYQQDFDFDELPSVPWNSVHICNTDPVITESFDFQTMNCSIRNRELKLAPYFGTYRDVRTKMTFEPDTFIGYTNVFSSFIDEDEDVCYFGMLNGYLAKWSICDKGFTMLTGGPNAIGGDFYSIGKDGLTGEIYLCDDNLDLLKYVPDATHWSKRTEYVQVHAGLYSWYWLMNDSYGNLWALVKRNADNHFGVIKVSWYSSSQFNDLGAAYTMVQSTMGVKVVNNRCYWTDNNIKLHTFDFPPNGLTQYTVTNLKNYTAARKMGYTNSEWFEVLSDGVYHLIIDEAAPNSGLYRLTEGTGTDTKMVSFPQMTGGGTSGASISNNVDRMLFVYNWPDGIKNCYRLYEYNKGGSITLEHEDLEMFADNKPGLMFEYHNNIFYSPQIELFQYGGKKSKTYSNGGVAWAKKSLPRSIIDGFWDNDFQFKVKFELSGGQNDYYLWYVVGDKTLSDSITDVSKHVGFKCLYDGSSLGVYGTVGNGASERTVQIYGLHLDYNTVYELEVKYNPNVNRTEFYLDGELSGVIEDFHPTGDANGDDEYIFNSYLRAWGDMNEASLRQVKFYKSG